MNPSFDLRWTARLLFPGLAVCGASLGLGYLAYCTLPVCALLVLSSWLFAARMLNGPERVTALGGALLLVALSFAGSVIILWQLLADPEVWPFGVVAFAVLVLGTWIGTPHLGMKRWLRRAVLTCLLAALPLVSMRGTHVAPSVKQGDTWHVRLLLLLGASPNEREQHHPVLAIAVTAGRLDLAKILLDAGADPNARADQLFNNSPVLFDAARSDDPALLRLLLERGVDPNLRDGSGESALFHAIRFGKTHNERLLLEFGTDPTLRDRSGKLAEDSRQ